ncbi:MAG: glycosyltransferase [archaeon]|nr:glycosyltransferase [archaeon]
MRSRNAVSLVVVTKDRRRYCTELLTSLADQKMKPSEIILLDLSDMPFKSPVHIAKELKIITRHVSDQISLGEARSLGVSMAKGNIIAFIDDDAVASPQWIKELIKKHNEGFDIVGGLITPLYVSNPPKWWDERIFSHLVSINTKDKEVWGCNMSVTRRTFEKIGVFNSMLGIAHGKPIGGEETEFLIRAEKAGLKTGFADNGVVYHKIPSKRLSLVYLIRRAYHVGVTINLIQTLHLNERQRIATKMRRMGGILKQLLKCLSKLLTLSNKEALLAITIILSDLGYILGKPPRKKNSN